MSRREWWGAVTVVGVLLMITAFVVMGEYPTPHVPGGWCQTDFNPHGYTVQTVTRLVLIADVVVACVVVAAAGAMAGRAGRGLVISLLTAVPVGVLLLLTVFTYMARVDCAFYG